MSGATVFRYFRSPLFPERQGRSDKGSSVLSPYKAYLLQGWNQGCYETKALFEEIQSQGYTGRETLSFSLPMIQSVLSNKLPGLI